MSPRHQTAQLRRSYPIVFGDPDNHEAYAAEVAEAIASQVVRFAVAPRVRLSVGGGRVLEPGDEVRPADVVGLGVEMRDLVSAGRVLEWDGPPQVNGQ